jgi:WhiB family transcriptional regulator, redox-sensing transcriptional regulator
MRKDSRHRIVVQAVLTFEERQDALCVQVDPEIWFPEKGASARDAKQVCARCPLAAVELGGNGRCLEVALENNELYGVFGGLAPLERRRLRAARKSEAA